MVNLSEWLSVGKEFVKSIFVFSWHYFVVEGYDEFKRFIKSTVEIKFTWKLTMNLIVLGILFNMFFGKFTYAYILGILFYVVVLVSEYKDGRWRAWFRKRTKERITKVMEVQQESQQASSQSLESNHNQDIEDKDEKMDDTEQNILDK